MKLQFTQELLDAALSEMDLSVSERYQELKLRIGINREKVAILTAIKIESMSQTDANGKKRTKDIFEALASDDPEIKKLKWQIIKDEAEVEKIDANFKRAQMILSGYNKEIEADKIRNYNN